MTRPGPVYGPSQRGPSQQGPSQRGWPLRPAQRRLPTLARTAHPATAPPPRRHRPGCGRRHRILPPATPTLVRRACQPTVNSRSQPEVLAGVTNEDPGHDDLFDTAVVGTAAPIHQTESQSNSRDTQVAGRSILGPAPRSRPRRTPHTVYRRRAAPGVAAAPVPLGHTSAHVGEPTRAGHQVDEQALADLRASPPRTSRTWAGRPVARH